MKAHSFLILLATFISSYAALSPEYDKKAQDSADEHLFITADSVTYDTVETDYGKEITAHVTAIVEKVIRSKSEISPLDTITFSYKFTPGIIGGIASPQIHQDEFLPAFLNHKEGSDYTLAAGESSFHYIYLEGDLNDTYGNNTSLLWGDKVWESHYNSFTGEIPDGSYKIISEKNNILFLQNDSVAIRCFATNDTLFVSPRENHPSNPEKGIISPNGASVSFHLLNETMNELVFKYPTEYSCGFGEYIELYDHNIEIRALAYSENDGKTHVGILDPLVYGTYRNVFISPGENVLIMENGKKVTIVSDTSAMSYRVIGTEDLEKSAPELDSLKKIWVGFEGAPYYSSVVFDSTRMILDSIVGETAYIRSESAGSSTGDQPGEVPEAFIVHEGDVVSTSKDSAHFLIKTVFTGLEKDGTEKRYIEILSLKKESGATSLVLNTKPELTLPSGKQEIRIFSANGRLVHRANLEYSQIGSMMKTLQLSKGIYILKSPNINRKFSIQ